MNRLQDDYDSYAVEEPSDEEPALSSSEDEVDVLLHGTPDQKRKLIRECLTGESESSEDEFEKEMEAELNSTIKTMEVKLSSLETGSSSGNGKVGTASTKYYDDIYFDSDSEDEDKTAQVTKRKKKKRHRILTNDELLYDPEKDNRDQAWVDARRRGKIFYHTTVPHSTKMLKQKRIAYKIPYKLEVIRYAKEHGNRAAERHFGPPPTEKMIREWRKQEDQLQKEDKSKHTLRGHAAKWPELEVDMKEWIMLHRNNGFSVSTKMIIFEAKRIAKERGIQDFTGSPSWCYRFMRRSGLAMRTK